MADDVDPFEIVKCRGCGKDVFPSERLLALKSIWHKGCLKCSTCGVVLTTKTLESWQNNPYCKAHLIKAKTGGGTQTAYTGATNVPASAKVQSGTKNWNPQEEVKAAKASGFQMPEEKHSVHSSQFRPAAQEEIAAAKASGWKDNPEEGKTFQASYNPAEVKGNVGAIRSKFNQPPPEPTPKIAPSKPPPKFGAAKAAAAPAPAPKPAPKLGKSVPRQPEPEPEPEPEPQPEQAWEEQPAEQTYEEHPAEQAYEEQPAEQAYEEQPAEQAHEEQPAEQAGGQQIAVALYDFAGEQEGDLSFNAGDQIVILDMSDPGGWWQGELNGVVGQFPSNFVQLQ